MVRVLRSGLRLCLWLALGAVGTIALILVTVKVSEFMVPPEGLERWFRTAYILIPWAVLAVVAIVLIAALPARRTIGLALLAGGSAAYVIVMFELSQPLVNAFKGPPDANTSLWAAVPDPWSSSGDYAGLARFTADELNRVRHGSEYVDITSTYVPGGVPSTGSAVVSVNPMNDYTWGAAALSLRGCAY